MSLEDEYQEAKQRGAIATVDNACPMPSQVDREESISTDQNLHQAKPVPVPPLMKEVLLSTRRPLSARCKPSARDSARGSASAKTANAGSASAKTANSGAQRPRAGLLAAASKLDPSALGSAKAAVDRAVESEAARLKALRQMRPKQPAAAGSARRSGVDPLLAHGYETMSPIANGAFSQITRARHLTTQQDVAIKTFDKAKYLQPGNEHLATAMKNELDVLRRLQPARHAGIANILEVAEDATNVRAVLEYCSGGSLKRLMAKASVGSNMARAFGLNGALSRSIAQQVFAALSHLHGVGIVHRDIKPDNVLLVTPTVIAASHATVKLCDFGFAAASGGRPVHTVCGTPQYMAPEIASAPLSRREPYLGEPCDMWAFGCLLFEMLEGRPAYQAASMEQLKMRILRASHEAFTPASPPPARALIKSCFKLEPSTRLKAEAALAF